MEKEQITIPLEVYKSLVSTAQKFQATQAQYVLFVERVIASLDLIREYYALKKPETLMEYFAKSEEDLKKSGIVVKKAEKFYDLLKAFMQRASMEEVELYTRAGLSKAVFSNIRSEKSVPKQETVIALALALKLNLAETKLLLESAGHSFLPGATFTKVITDALKQNFVSVDDVNELLLKNGLEVLGTKVR